MRGNSLCWCLWRLTHTRALLARGSLVPPSYSTWVGGLDVAHMSSSREPHLTHWLTIMESETIRSLKAEVHKFLFSCVVAIGAVHWTAERSATKMRKQPPRIRKRLHPARSLEGGGWHIVEPPEDEIPTNEKHAHRVLFGNAAST